MSDDDTTTRIAEARAALDVALRDWFAAHVKGGAVLTSWYLITAGTGFDSEGDEVSHIVQDWHANIVEQLGLLRYANERVRERMEGFK